MNHAAATSVPPWWRARSLAERAASAVDGVAAPERLARWEQSLPDPEVLGERLRSAGVPAARLTAALAEHAPPCDAEAPAWWRFVTSVLAPGTCSPVREAADEEDADVLRGALRLVAPFARRVRAQLREQPTAREDAIRLLTHNVAFELAELCRPALALELAASRAAEGWTADEAPSRAAALLRSVGRAETARALFAEHPGLARMVAQRARFGLEAGHELLERLAADLPRVRDEILGGEEPGAISEIAPLGDTHDGGRRVLRLGFDSGARLVYKPRSLAADLAYQRLLAALGRRGLQPAVRTLATVAAGPGHGWQEWAVVQDCHSAGAGRYYRRLGAQLALLYALFAVDLHQENVLACGEHPALVDLEGVLHPRLGGSQAAVVDPEIAETGTGSVLRVGLLPRADVAFGVDIGGLGRDPLARVEVHQLDWVGGAGEARLENRRIELPTGPNVPRVGGEPARAQEHVEALAGGFADAYRLLVAHREELLAPGGELAAFGDVPIRFILRPTKVYVDLLRRQASDAAALDDGLAREEALNVLWRGALRRPDLRVAAAAEHHDLWHGDVPKITGRPGSGDGRHHALGVLPGLLSPHVAPGPDVVRRLDERDLERQLALLRASVLAAAARPATAVAAGGHAAPDEGRPSASPSRERLAAGVARVVRRLAMLALHDERGRAGWLVPVAADGHPGRVLRAAGPGLADGQAGIVLFLGLAARATGDPQARTLARAGVAQLLVQLDGAAGQIEDVGLCAGAGGVLLALGALATALDDAALHDRAVQLAAAADGVAREERDLDMAGGLAGWVTGLAALLVSGPLRAGLARDARRLARAPGARAAQRADRALALARAGAALGDPELIAASAHAAAAVRARRRAARARAAAALDALDRSGLGATAAVEAPGISDGLAGLGLTWLEGSDQVAADAAAAALFCSAP